MDQSSLLIIIIIIVVIVVIFWCFNDSDGHHGHKKHHHGKKIHIDGCCDDGCCNDEVCLPPSNVTCESLSNFSLKVCWDCSPCDVDHYKVFIKYTDDEGQCDPPMTPPTAHRRSAKGMIDVSKMRKGSTVRSKRVKRGRTTRRKTRNSRQPRHKVQACGPNSYDRIITVPGDQTCVTIGDIKVPYVCASVVAVNKCGVPSECSEECCTCIDCAVETFPWIVESDCRGLTIRWNKVDCAIAYKIYYDGQLMFELPADASGATGLPPIDEDPIVVTVSVCTECGEGPQIEVSPAAPL